MTDLNEILKDIQQEPIRVEDARISLEDHVAYNQETEDEEMVLSEDLLDPLQEKLDQISEIESTNRYIIERGYITRSLAQESFAAMPFLSVVDKNVVTKLTESPSQAGVKLVTHEFYKEIDFFQQQVDDIKSGIIGQIKRHLDTIETKKVLDAIRFTIPVPMDELIDEQRVLFYSIHNHIRFKDMDDFYNDRSVQKDITNNYLESYHYYFTENDQIKFLYNLHQMVEGGSPPGLERAFFAVSLIYKIYSRL